MQTHIFHKEASEWFIDLPEYLAQGGSKGDLAMVDGADTMLDIMAKGSDSVTLQIDTNPFLGADLVELLEVCDPFIGGGDYLMRQFEGESVNQRLWLCAVVNFVFGDIPPAIYVKRVIV